MMKRKKTYSPPVINSILIDASISLMMASENTEPGQDERPHQTPVSGNTGERVISPDIPATTFEENPFK